MARKRMIDPSIWTDDGMGTLTPREQLLFIGLFSNADDEGRLKGAPQAIRLILPTIYSDLGEAEVRSDLDAVLSAMRHLSRYEIDGREYLEFANYGRWQRIDRPAPSAIPPLLVAVHEDSWIDPRTVLPSLKEVSLVEEKGIEEKRTRARRAPRLREPITEQEKERLTVEFGPMLGGEAGVRDRIAGALNHVAVEKAKSEYLYVRTWLRNDVDRQPKGGSNGRTGANTGKPAGAHPEPGSRGPGAFAAYR